MGSNSSRNMDITVSTKYEDRGNLAQIEKDLAKVVEAGGELAPVAANLTEQLKTLSQQQTLIDRFSRLKTETNELRTRLDQARERATKLGQELASTEQPTAKMRREFEKAQAEVGKLEAKISKQQTALGNARSALSEAGISTNKLAAEQIALRKAMGQVLSEADQLPGKMQAAVAAEKEAADAAQVLAEAQRKAAAEAKAIDGKLAGIEQLAAEFAKTRAETTRLGNELAQIKNPSAALRREFEASVRTTLQLQNRLAAQQTTLSRLGNELIETSADTSRFADVQIGVTSALNQSSVAAHKFERSLIEASAGAQKLEKSAQKSSLVVDFMKSKFLALGATVAGLASAGQVFDSMLQFDRAKRGFVAITGSASAAAREIEYIRRVSNQLGTDQSANMRTWLKFSAAVKGTALEGEKARQVYESVNSAMVNVGADANATESALRALEQMVSKGTVTSEEFKTQLADQLPGALDKAAKSIGVTKEEFLKLLETGSIVAEDFLPRFAAELDKTFGGANQKVTGLSASWERLKNSLFGAAGDTGGGLLGGALTKAMDGLTARITALDQAIKKFSERDISGGLTSGIGSVKMAVGDAASFINPQLGTLTKAFLKTGEAQQKTGESAGKLAGQLDKTTQAGSKATQSLYRQQVDLISARKAFDENSKSSELAAKANVATADSALGAANAERTRAEALALSANSQRQVAEQARAIAVAEETARQVSIDKANADLQLQETLLANKHQDLTLSQQELFMLEQQLNSKTEVSEADRQSIVVKKEKIGAIRAEIIALKAATEEAKANASAVRQGADTTASAFEQLGLRSQRQIQLTVERNRLAFEQIQSDVASGKTTIEDSNAAFLVYAQSVAQSSKMATTSVGKAQAEQQMALLRTQAATKGLIEEFQRLAGMSGGGGGGGEGGEHKGLRNLSDGVHEVKTEAEKAKEAAERMSNGFGESSLRIGNDLREMAEKSGVATKMVLKNVGMATQELAALSQTALQAFAANHQEFGDWMGIAEKTTELEALQGQINKTRMEIADLRNAAAQFGDSGESFAVAIKNQTVQVLEQKMALAQTVQELKNLPPELGRAAISADELKKRFDLLDDADLSQLDSAVGSVNSQLDQLNSKAQSATDKLNQMANASMKASQSEQERLRRELLDKQKEIKELEDSGGDKRAADRARAAAQREYETQLRDMQRKESDRKKQEEKKTVNMKIDIPGGKPKEMEVAEESVPVMEDFTRDLVKQLTDLNRRGAR